MSLFSSPFRKYTIVRLLHGEVEAALDRAEARGLTAEDTITFWALSNEEMAMVADALGESPLERQMRRLA